MKRTKQPSIRLWALAAAVGVFYAAVMIIGAAQEKPREAARESEEPRVKPIVQEVPQEAPVEVPEVEQETVEEIPAEVVEDYENEKIEAALLAKANVIEDCEITFYCCEKYPHICGTGDGLTATGNEVQPYVTVAVDPRVIPLGSQVMVDFGDGEIHYFIADDVGGAVKGNHIDIAVVGHREALELGVKTATVWWIEE